MRRVLLAVGLVVPLDGRMHVTWAGQALDRIGLGKTARALGIGFVPDRVLTKWACQREQAALNAYTDTLHTLAQYAPAVARGLAAENADRGIFTQIGRVKARMPL